VGTIVKSHQVHATHAVDVGIDGRWHVTVTVKAAFSWTKTAMRFRRDPALRRVDEFAGEPATSGLLRASEVGPPKTKSMCFSLVPSCFPSPSPRWMSSWPLARAYASALAYSGIACGFRECLDFRSCVRRPSVENVRNSVSAEIMEELAIRKAGLLTDALVAGHGPVRCETLFPRLAPGRCQLRRQVYRRDEVHFVRGLTGECRMWHLRVVLLMRTPRACAAVYRVERVQIQTMMLRERQNARSSSWKRRPRLAQGRGSGARRTRQVHRTVDVFRRRNQRTRQAGLPDQMLASCEQNLARRRWLQFAVTAHARIFLE